MTLLAFVLFVIGAVGVIARKSILVILMSIEIMLNASNLLLITFARVHQDPGGHAMAFMVMAVAAAEVAVGLGIVVAIFRNLGAEDASRLSTMRH